MGYLHIQNLYRPEGQTILLFRECYALEKIHGTSAHVAWRDGKVWFSGGAASEQSFKGMFDEPAVVAAFMALGHPKVVVHGEAYGGSLLKQGGRYGKSQKFVAFDVKIEDTWLDVPNALDVVTKLGLEFVAFNKVSTDLPSLDAERDMASTQACRNGVPTPQIREGVVLRPLKEMTLSNGDRVICKHKRAEFMETATEHPVVDPSKQVVLDNAQAIASEWVTPNRLEHVLSKLPQGIGMDKTVVVINAMVEDVTREAAGEVVDSKEARTAIGKLTAVLFKKFLKDNA